MDPWIQAWIGIIACNPLHWMMDPRRTHMFPPKLSVLSFLRAAMHGGSSLSSQPERSREMRPPGKHPLGSV